MNLTQLTSADLKRLASLLDEKEALQAKIARIDAQLGSFDSGKPGPAPEPARKPVPGKRRGRAATGSRGAGGRARRGELKSAILELIRGAGPSGVSVKDIAGRLGSTYGRVFTWFYTTGKDIKEIKKMAPGIYGWTGNGAAKSPAPAPKPAAPKAAAPAATPSPAPAKSRGGKRAKPGQFKDSVIEAVKSAGKSGINVKDIASKLGLDAQRIYVWFNATGKKVKSIKKVAPATYAWAG